MTRASIYLILDQPAAQRQLSEEATCVGGGGLLESEGGGAQEGADPDSESSFCFDSDRVQFSLYRGSAPLRGGLLKWPLLEVCSADKRVQVSAACFYIFTCKIESF